MMKLICSRNFLLPFTLALLSQRLCAQAQENKTHGAALFMASGCQHCHVIGGVGGDKGPDLSGVGRRLNEDRIRNQIQQGSQVMPAFGEVLSKEDTDDLVAYLRTCRDKTKSAKAK